MAASASLSLSESLNASWSSDCDWCCQFQDLPNEVLVLILRYLPLPDLANTRLVCTRLQKLVDDHGSRYLWAKATLEGNCLWLSKENKRIIRRAANHGNVEALIMLAVAHLYSEGVPEGAGKGTYDAHNGIKATEYLIKAEQLTPHISPFSWVLFRPPWASNNMCCKACVCQRMKDHCEDADTDAAPIGIHYSIAKVLTFHEASEGSGSEDGRDAAHWFELGSDVDCLHSALEVWRKNHKPSLWKEPYEAVRRLRRIISLGGSVSFLHEARLELCSAYSRGFYGGKSKEQALTYVREVMGDSKAVLWDRVHQLQETISHSVRYILIDWIVEVAGMKFFSPQTVHLAINLIDRYLIHRSIPRSKLQLLGVTALLVAARWSSDFILTVREASWLTEETYQYEDVVRMMGGLVAAFKGDVKRETICDYLEVMLDLIKANTSTRNMAYYLSETILLHAKFGRYSAAHLAAACLLEARILLGQEYPWPQCMVEATGFTVSGLRKCCLAIYDECLSNKNLVTDHRKIKLEAVANRYATDTFGNISKHDVMSYKELKEQLGVDPDSSYLLFTPTPKPPRQTSKTDKLLSFISDSCYLTPSTPASYSEPRSTNHSPLLSLSDSESIGSNSSSLARHGHLEISSNLIEQFNTHCLSSSSSSPNRSQFNLSPSELEGLPVSSPYSPSCCSSQSLTINPSASGFPQPVFSECDLSPSSSPWSPCRESPTLQAQENIVERFSSNSVASGVGNGSVASDYCGGCMSVPYVQDEMMDTEDGTIPSPQGHLTSLKKSLQLQDSIDQSTPFETRPLRQGSEETPFEPDVTLHGHNLAAKQKLTLSVSDTLKAQSLNDPCKINGRVALKPLKVGNVVSPVCFYGDKSTQSEKCAAGQFMTDTSIDEPQVSRKRK